MAIKRSLKDGILGFAIGDALGVPVEYYTREELQKHPVTNMTDYASTDFPRGTWSDDTSMTLATLDALITNGLDYEQIANNFVAWIDSAKYTPYGIVADVGRTCLKAIYFYHASHCSPEEAGGKAISDNGNGSLMRMLPIVYYCYYQDLPAKDILEIVNKVSSITHGHEISILACYIYVQFAIELLKNKSKEQAYRFIQNLDYSSFSEETKKEFSRILTHSIAASLSDTITSSTYVIHTLEACFWAFLTSENYEDAVLKAVNLGEDTDTVGACTRWSCWYLLWLCQYSASF